MKPLIGITASTYQDGSLRYSRLSENYTRSVRLAGGIPILLPFDLEPEEAAASVENLDGILFSGGPDIAPVSYGQQPLSAVKMFCSKYDRAELAVFAAAQARRLPVFGICRGSQLVNIALGGSLVQDIATQRKGAHGHYPDGLPMYEPYHTVDIQDSASVMGAVFGSGPVQTNSFHHQAVDLLAEGLKVTASARDGIIEAYEGTSPDWYLSCVQFHPEAQTQYETKFVDLFRHFVRAAAAFAGKA